MQEFLTFMKDNWTWIVSVVTIFGGVLLYLIRRIIALEKGIQALLRANMINDYNHYSEKGFAPIYARQNFENCWKQYHALGANGVMDDIHKKFMELPTKDK